MEKQATGRAISESYFEKPTWLKTSSRIPVKEIYTPEDIKDIDYARDIGNAGEYPFVRGIYEDMYRGRLWSRRELCGFASPKATNARMKYQIEQGATGLNFIGDLPTDYGIDSDHPLAEGALGVMGVPICSIKDMETVTAGIPLEEVSLNISVYVHPVLAFYVATAEERGYDLSKLRGTFLGDASFSQTLVRHLPVPWDVAERMVVDCILYCAEKMPRYIPINIGPHALRESGTTAPQDIAFDFCIARYWIKKITERGVSVDDFARNITFSHRVGIDIFEEAAKYRAARKVWAKMLKEEFGAKDPRTMRYRVHAQTLGVRLQRPQAINNIIRTTCQALAAILGGAQSVDVMSFDEPLGLPTEESQRIALRIQQIICYETNVVNTTDPLGGSYYVELLTTELEKKITEIMDEWKDKIREAVVSGELMRFIRGEAYQYQKEVESGERTVVGVNRFTVEEEPGKVRIFELPEEEVRQHLENAKEFKRTRDTKKVAQALEGLRKVAQSKEGNTFSSMVEAAKARATLEEMMGVMRMAFGHDYDPYGKRKYPFA